MKDYIRVGRAVSGEGKKSKFQIISVGISAVAEWCSFYTGIMDDAGSSVAPSNSVEFSKAYYSWCGVQWIWLIFPSMAL